jgi:hypothetical protein
MNAIEIAYYRLRLAAEQQAVAQAAHPRAAASHRILADHYAGLLTRAAPMGAA